MSNKWIAPVVLLSLAACGPRVEKRSTAELEKILKTAVEQKLVPGVVAAVAIREGVVWEAAEGFSKDAIFAIASMTKPVTSVAVMQLVEQGKVKLDEPASTYVPELGKVQVLDNGKLRPPKSAVTVRQLLTHTSGFAYEFMNAPLMEFVKKGGAPSLMAGGDAFLKQPLMFDPGTAWEYGISIDWLGRLVERVSGQDLEQYFRRNIFEPLGMEDSFFNVPEAKQPRRAAASQRMKDGSLVPQTRQPAKRDGFFSGGGGLSSTAADYMKFARALMAGGQLGQERILTAGSVAMMGQNQIAGLTIKPFTSLLPQLATDGAALPGGLDKFGLGFALNSQKAGGRGVNTMAWAGIFNTFFWIDTENQICAVLMSQMSPGLDDGPRRLLEDFDRAVYTWRGQGVK
ncbi:MAG: beta-lactamase family protein [Candidatus Solibacter usitatus]|nr:beta-lactamase family protein [Candidatus Solibacter usitatus]